MSNPATNAINAESAKFIDWAITELRNPAAYEAAIDEIKERLANFYQQSPEMILNNLEAKMVRGAKEHGEPYYPAAKIEQEINNEYIDLLGWMLIERWNQRHAK